MTGGTGLVVHRDVGELGCVLVIFIIDGLDSNMPSCGMVWIEVKQRIVRQLLTLMVGLM